LPADRNHLTRDGEGREGKSFMAIYEYDKNKQIEFIGNAVKPIMISKYATHTHTDSLFCITNHKNAVYRTCMIAAA